MSNMWWEALKQGAENLVENNPLADGVMPAPTPPAPKPTKPKAQYWVPNFDAGMPTYRPNGRSGYPVGGSLPGSGGAPLPGVKDEGRVVQRGDWLYKVDGSGRIIWKRLVT